jgi:hypothetical protein
MMEAISISDKSGILSEIKARTNFSRMNLLPEENGKNPVISYLIAEGGENFYYFLKELGLADEPNMMILSARHYYYYDKYDLKGVTNLLNLKRLNLMKHLDSFLHTVSNASSHGSNFIGCFTDSRSLRKTELPVKRYRGFINSLDCRIEIEFDRDDVSALLESHCFRVNNMTEINGLIYFRAENRKKIFN